MYRQIQFKFEGGTWTVHLPETAPAQKFGRICEAITRQKILPYLLRKWADGLVITTVFVPIEIDDK